MKSIELPATNRIYERQSHRLPCSRRQLLPHAPGFGTPHFHGIMSEAGFTGADDEDDDGQ